MLINFNHHYSHIILIYYLMSITIYMTPIDKVIIDKSTSIKPIWIMRQQEDIYEFRD